MKRKTINDHSKRKLQKYILHYKHKILGFYVQIYKIFRFYIDLYE